MYSFMMLLAYHVVLAAIQLEGAHLCVHFVLLLANHAGELHVNVLVQVVVLLVIQAVIWSGFVLFEPSNSNLV